jgi:hypothetical protein
MSTTPSDHDRARFASAMEAMKSLTQEDVLQFFAERKVNTNCPSCGANVWSLIAGDLLVQLHVVPVTRSGAPDIGTNALPTIGMVCENCGHVRQHAAVALGLWLRDRRAKAELFPPPPKVL